MPFENLRTGSRVKAGGKEGNIREVGDKFKVKFDDGSVGFYDGNEVTPVTADHSLKGIYNRMKEESKMKPNQELMTSTATGEDPLAQPVRRTGHGIGEPQNVLGKAVTFDRLA